MVTDLGLNEKQAKDFKAAMEEMKPAKINRMKTFTRRNAKEKERSRC